MKDRKMKTAIFVIALLALSMFAVPFALAQAGAETAAPKRVDAVGVRGVTSIDVSGRTQASVTSVDLPGVTADEESQLDASLSAIAELENGKKRFGFAKLFRGFGSIHNDEQAYLFTGFWISQKFVEISASAQEVTEADAKSRAFGTIHIRDAGNYKLVKANTDSETEESVMFYIVSDRRKFTDLEESVTSSIGTLELEQTSKYGNIAKWKGTLEITSAAPEEIQGSWDVELWTSEHTIRKSIAGETPKISVDADSETDAKFSDNARLTLRERIKAFLGIN